ncbi:lytic transglycosylase domain-containing protein [uncultured Flavobacterium sp.]|uniref:lytic transglycosylase domain-containing protein n=1 Tax=uncultured Flavobacterium sp. TaxID=165435 RepID=UPI0030EF1735
MRQKFKRALQITGIIAISSLFIYATSTTINKISHSVTYPTEMNFSGETVPTSDNDVSERLDREMVTNMNYHSNTTLVIKRANKVFPIIEPILKRNGVPDDFKYLAVIESSLVNAVSPAGARGVWQFMPATAKEYGMEVTDHVDERYHLEKSTEAACKYLNDAYEKFGNWTLVAASYNGGMAGVNRVLEAQQVSSYYDALFYEETGRYVFRILALKEIMKNSPKYGFDIPQSELYVNVPTKKLHIETSIEDLASFALEQGTNYKTLKVLNPWLRDKKLSVLSGKTYLIEVPE